MISFLLLVDYHLVTIQWIDIVAVNQNLRKKSVSSKYEILTFSFWEEYLVVLSTNTLRITIIFHYYLRDDKWCKHSYYCITYYSVIVIISISMMLYSVLLCILLSLTTMTTPLLSIIIIATTASLLGTGPRTWATCGRALQRTRHDPNRLRLDGGDIF